MLECCSQAETTDGRPSILNRSEDIDRRFMELSNAGLRVLGLATRTDDSRHLTKEDE
ncbi:MAG: hypothetical protein U0903_14150 [Planctomycetales bacterium]